MTVLEFIRKNSILVLIVIVGLFVGLVMMDYSGKGSAFSRDYYFKVNGTSYDLSEAESLGSAGLSYMRSAYYAANNKLKDKFDANNNDILEEGEKEAMSAWLETHPEYQDFMHRMDLVMQIWGGVGISKRAETNFAINRAVLHEEAKRLGIKPSKEQLDAYISKLPIFTNEDGSFDQALYQKLVGFKDGMANNSAEQTFRSVMEDMMVWGIMESMLTSDICYYSPAIDRLADMRIQEVSGRTAWLPATAVGMPAAPTEEEIKAYWEGHKSAYKTPERRIATIYTLTAGEGSNPNDLAATADTLLREIGASNGRDIEKALQEASKNPEIPAFTYEVNTSAACTQDAPDDILKTEVVYAEDKAPLVTVVFKEVQEAPALAAYEKAKAAGKAEELVTLRQVPGYYSTADDKVVFVRVDAIDAPRELTFEEAKESATKDLVTERENNALQIAAEKMLADMQAAMADGVDAAFQKAGEAGATVEAFGPVNAGLGAADNLPSGMDAYSLMSSPKGRLMPLVVLADGARVSVVEKRTVEENQMLPIIKLQYIQTHDNMLKLNVMMDWLLTSTQQMVEPSKYITDSAE